ncbi:MAG: isochorismate synthase [Bacteroidaceae bacterium]|nr:isochorismate synthase [Bacteroidaceae bacterium]
MGRGSNFIFRTTDIADSIKELIESNLPFVLFRKPDEDEFSLLAGGEISLFDDIQELNGKSGYVISPFCITNECPIVLINPDICKWKLPVPERSHPLNNCKEKVVPYYKPTLPEAPYVSRFQCFIKELCNRTFDKLVLSYMREVNACSGFSPVDAFFQACRCYPHLYVYLCYTPQTGMWMGSTPEVLLSGKKQEWRTVALAGTQSLTNGKLPQCWDVKNKEEQAYVAAYIRNCLQQYDICFSEEGPFSVFAGDLSHLKTEFRFSLNNQRLLGDLLKLLHPTPAVCGLPKEQTYRFILEHEGNDRKYYSGFIGYLDPEGETDIYVNLRCMQIEGEKLHLYAGSGILSSSTVEDEWQEVEKKWQTIEKVITNY